MANICNTLASVQEPLNKNKAAIENYRYALKPSEELGEPLGTALMMNNLANVLEKEGDTEEALLLYKSAL